MSSPLLWFGQKAKLLKSILQIPGSTSGSIDIAAPATPTPHQLTLPAAQGAASTVLTNDGSGNLSWAPAGGSSVTTFPLVNNQTSPANVTGFLVNSATNTAFSAPISVRQENTVTVVGGNDGTPNATFQTNAGASGANSDVLATIVLPDGSVIIAGDFTSYNGVSVPRIAKLSALGVLDTTFNTNLGAGPDAAVRCLHRQSTGKIVIGGEFLNVDAQAFSRLARLNADGTIDSAFMNTLGGFDGAVNAVASLSATNNENLIVGGDFTSFTDESMAVNTAPNVFALSINGKFQVPGIVFIPTGTGFNALVKAIEVDLATDDVYFGGQFTQYDGVSTYKTMKANSTGAKQSGFDALGSPAGTFIANDLVLQPDGKLIVVGEIQRNLTDRIDIWRYLSSGAADTTFNNTVAILGAGGNGANAVALQSDGKILIGGPSVYNSIRRFSRYESTGASDTTFNTFIANGFNIGGEVKCIALGADDVAYVGGSGLQNYALVGAISDNIIMLGEIGSTTTTEYWIKSSIEGCYTPAGVWEIAYGTGVGSIPSPNVTFTITSLGQLQYTTGNLPGTVTLNEMRFLVEGL